MLLFVSLGLRPVGRRFSGLGFRKLSLGCWCLKGWCNVGPTFSQKKILVYILL